MAEGRADGRTEIRTPISHPAKTGAQKEITNQTDKYLVIRFEEKLTKYQFDLLFLSVYDKKTSNAYVNCYHSIPIRFKDSQLSGCMYFPLKIPLLPLKQFQYCFFFPSFLYLSPRSGRGHIV